jgi:DNA polymerase II small subunit/DNA polymerase delta subunit B
MVALDRLLDALEQGPGVLEVPVQHDDLAESLPQPVPDQVVDHLLKHPAG